MMRKLVDLSQIRPNLIPILDDATKPRNYLHLVEKADIIYSDVAQPKPDGDIHGKHATVFKRRWCGFFDAEGQEHRRDQKSGKRFIARKNQG